MKKPITAVLFGAGNRGAEAYGPYALAHPGELKFVAVAEPDPARRERFAEANAIPKEQRFASWEEVVEQERMADCVFNCTQDQMHYSSGVAALEAGYDMLLEKPICNTLYETVYMVQKAEALGRVMHICHVLRFTDFWQKVYDIVRSDRLGQIITISHRENVSSWHMAHSFVRGNWRRLDQSAPMILAKCCHDLDLLYWMVGQRVSRLSSVGNLRHFRVENAPPGAPQRCTDGCPVEENCPFYAPAVYVDLQPIKIALSQSGNPLYRLGGKLALSHTGLVDGLGKVLPILRGLTEYNGWPRSVLCDDPSGRETLMSALRTGPYGRCVYHCDNDVVDHQVVIMEFENGVTASLTMHGHSEEEGRTLRIDGSQASLFGKFGYSQSYIEVRDHRQAGIQRLNFPSQVEKQGHGGGDFGVVRGFVRAMRGEGSDTISARESMESHILAFAAEQSRLDGEVVEFADFRKRAERLIPGVS